MNRRVTIPDVVAKTGLSLGIVSSALNDLAYELKADLDVTNTGQIYYSFPPDLHYRYYSNRVLEIANKVWDAIFPFVSFLFRISFGVILLFSITLVFLVMLVLQSLMSVFSGNTNDVLGLIKEFFMLLKRLQLFQQLDPKLFKKQSDDDFKEQLDESETGDRGFLLNCYALLFGPPDPNRNFENEKSKAVAKLIRANSGIILPEQLAPLIGSSADEVEGAFPVLAKFHGVPGATNSGHLLYRFPEMQAAIHSPVTNFSPEIADDDTDVPDLETVIPPRSVKMQPCIFADISADSMKPIFLLALSNFLGTVFFWCMLFAVRSSDSASENFFLVLAVYASFFLFFPALRWVTVQIKNRKIKAYNEKIEKLEAELNNAPPELTLAFNEVHKIRREEIAQLTDKLAYTTSRDYLEQETDHLIENTSETDKPAV